MTFGKAWITCVRAGLLFAMACTPKIGWSKCDFLFEEFQLCAEIDWPNPPLTFVANHFAIAFFEMDGTTPIQRPLPKLEVTLYNYYETRWALAPEVSTGDQPHIRLIRNIYFDKPGFWQIFLHLIDGNVISKHQIRVQLEDYE
jgi:hypothetical protein